MPTDDKKKKYKGSYVESFKEDVNRMVAASTSRQQGRSNLTSEDLKPKTKEMPKSGSATVKNAPNGKPYAGPAYGESKTQEQVSYRKPERKEDKTSPAVGRAMSAAEQRYMTERERRKNGQSNVVGS